MSVCTYVCVCICVYVCSVCVCVHIYYVCADVRVLYVYTCVYFTVTKCTNHKEINEKKQKCENTNRKKSFFLNKTSASQGVFHKIVHLIP